MLKSILKKIFPTASKSSAVTGKTYRATRVQLFPLYKVHFLRLDPPATKPISIANLSYSGVGFVRDNGVEWNLKMEKVSGKIVFEDTEVEAVFRVARMSDTIVGCEVVTNAAELRRAIDGYFTYAIAANEMVEVNPEILKSEPDGKPHLFRGGNATELFFVEQNDELVRFQLSFFGNFLEGGKDLPTRHGYLENDQAGDDSGQARYKATTLVRLVSGLPADTLDAAQKFIASIPRIPEKQRKALTDALKK